MATEHRNDKAPEGGSKSGKAKGKPDWSDGLRQLYDSVVDEPLPDSFADLLNQLDDSSDQEGD